MECQEKMRLRFTNHYGEATKLDLPSEIQPPLSIEGFNKVLYLKKRNCARNVTQKPI